MYRCFVLLLFIIILTLMNISHEEVKYIAKLARLELNEAETIKFSQQLSGILSHARMLDEIDTEGVEPIAQVTGLENVMFKDTIKDCDYKDALLKETPQTMQDHMIKVKNVF